MPRTIKTGLPPEFNTFAELTGCDDKGQNEYPVAVNPACVEAVTYFSALTGGEVIKVHFLSGHSILLKSMDPVAEPLPASSDVQGGATHVFDKEDTFERDSAT
jgi:hypothetical protein